MMPRPFTRTTFAHLPIGTCFTDPNFDSRKPIPAKCGLSDFLTTYARHGMFIKIHPEFAYRDGPARPERDGPDRSEEAVVHYAPHSEIICGNAAGFNSQKISDPLALELLSKIMELGPAGTSTQQIRRCFQTYEPHLLDASLAKLTAQPKARYPKLARLDGLYLRLTSDGVRLALQEGYKYIPTHSRG